MTGQLNWQDVKTFIYKLKSLDLGPIAFQLMDRQSGQGWSRKKTLKAIAQYLMFLCLVYLYPNHPLVPSQEIDTVWHHHILDTHKYAQDCEMLFGRFLHHFPYFGTRDEGDRQQLHLAFGETQALFHQVSSVLAISPAQSEDSPPAPASCLLLGANESDLTQAGACILIDANPQARPRIDFDPQEILPRFEMG